MRTGSRSIANLFLLLVLVGGLLPACSPPIGATAPHDQEHALLLQISSHVRLTGEPDLGSNSSNQSSLTKLAYLRPLVAQRFAEPFRVLVHRLMEQNQ